MALVSSDGELRMPVLPNLGSTLRRIVSALFVIEHRSGDPRVEDACPTASGRCHAMSYGNFAADWIVEQMDARRQARGQPAAIQRLAAGEHAAAVTPRYESAP